MKLNDINQILYDYVKNNPERAQADFDLMIEYFEQCSASERTGCKRTYYLPKVFRETDVLRFKKDMRILYSVISKVTRKFFSDSDYRKLFRFDSRTEQLVLSQNPGQAVLPLARIDLFFDEKKESYKFCEFNADGSSCMNCDRELNIGQRYSSAYALLEKQYRLRSEELFDSWVSAALRIYKRVRGTDNKPYIAIVDYLEGGYVNEFHVFKNHFINAGCGCEVCDVRELNYKNGILTGPENKKIDVVYRRAVTSDVLLHYDESQALIKAFADDSVVPLGGFHTQIAHSKVLFEVLFDDETRSFLNDEECDYIDEHVPFTKVLYTGDKDKLYEDKNKWIVKPVDGYASRGFHAGLDMTISEWKKLIDEIKDGTYVMQEFVPPYKTHNFRYGKWFDIYNLSGIFIYDGEYSGIFSRVSPEDTCLDVDMLPTVIIDDSE